MSTHSFVKYCLETFDENFEQNFRDFPQDKHKEFIIYFVEEIRDYSLAEFNLFQKHNRDKVIFENLSKESFELFVLVLCVHYKFNYVWTFYFAKLFPNIEQMKPYLQKLKQ